MTDAEMIGRRVLCPNGMAEIVVVSQLLDMALVSLLDAEGRQTSRHGVIRPSALIPATTAE